MKVDVFALPVHPAADLFPMLREDELRDLVIDIAANGMHEPLWLWQDPERGWVLLDGRNRRAACEIVGVPDPTWRRYEGDDPIGFALSENMKRRHLTAGQREFVGLAAERVYAKQAVHGRPAKVADPPPLPKGKARDLAANAVPGSTPRGIQRAKRVEEQAPDLADKVKAGDIALDRAERIVRDREAEERRVAQAKAEADAQPEPTLVDIRLGDFRDVLADLENVDAIITDPPYPAEFLPLLADLAAWADKVLAEDGVLAVLMGHIHLPEVFRQLDGFRPYRWTACYLMEGAGYVCHPRKVQTNWKPLLVYGGGPRFSDIVRSEGENADAKNNHKWGQDYGAFHTIVDRLTSRGQTVADPFMGSGTTLLAAHALGRHAIGADTDPDSVATATERLS